MLEPIKEEQEVPTSTLEIERLVGKAHPRFVQRIHDFLAKFQPGDEVVEFCTSRRTWDGLCGRAGFRLVRGGSRVAELVTAHS